MPSWFTSVNNALPPGVTACPQCGEAFDEAVPPDAEVPRKGWKTRGDTLSVVVPPTVNIPPPTPELAPVAAYETPTDEPKANSKPEQEQPIIPPPPIAEHIAGYEVLKPLPVFKAKWYDIVMICLTVLAAVALPGYKELIRIFYFLVVLGYAMDGITWCFRKLFLRRQKS